MTLTQEIKRQLSRKTKLKYFLIIDLKMCAKFGAVMEKISVNQLKKRGAPQLRHAPQKGNIR